MCVVDNGALPLTESDVLILSPLLLLLLLQLWASIWIQIQWGNVIKKNSESFFIHVFYIHVPVKWRIGILNSPNHLEVSE